MSEAKLMKNFKICCLLQKLLKNSKWQQILLTGLSLNAGFAWLCFGVQAMTSALEKISVMAERESMSEAVEANIFVDVAWKASYG